MYDPTTGQIRNSSTDDIACWFIDTDYNGESFFVRHAYFTGADEPYEKLKRALRAEIDEAAWSALYRTTSRPFDPPETGKIAVKVINHYGDEVLKVFDVADRLAQRRKGESNADWPGRTVKRGTGTGEVRFWIVGLFPALSILRQPNLSPFAPPTGNARRRGTNPRMEKEQRAMPR